MACEPKQRSSEACDCTDCTVCFLRSLGFRSRSIRTYLNIFKTIGILKDSRLSELFQNESHLFSILLEMLWSSNPSAIFLFPPVFFSDPNKQDQMSMEWEISTNQALMTEAIHL